MTQIELQFLSASLSLPDDIKKPFHLSELELQILSDDHSTSITSETVSNKCLRESPKNLTFRAEAAHYFKSRWATSISS